MTDQIAMIIIGLVAGLTSGLTGTGGGIVIVPCLTLFIGFSQHLSQGTSSMAIVFATVAGTCVNLRNRRVNLKPAAIVGLVGACGGFIGATLAEQVDAEILTKMFGGLLLVVGLKMAIETIWPACPSPIND